MPGQQLIVKPLHCVCHRAAGMVRVRCRHIAPIRGCRADGKRNRARDRVIADPSQCKAGKEDGQEPERQAAQRQAEGDRDHPKRKKLIESYRAVMPGTQENHELADQCTHRRTGN